MTRDFAPGNYRFIPAVFQYSSGAAALPGYEIERVRFDKWLPLADGFAQVAKYIQAAGRPLTSFCACELRSPAAFTEDGFRKFNEHYVKTLARVGPLRRLHQPGGAQQCLPRDRSAVRAVILRLLVHPAGPSGTPTPSFVIAGSARSARGRGSYPERTVRYRDLSPEGLKEKVGFTVGAMEGRMGELRLRLEGCDRRAGLYRARFSPGLADELVAAAPRVRGLTWHFARPPVIDLEYEMDCRRVMREMVI